MYASVCAVARAFPLYNRKSSYLQSESKEVVIIETILVGNDQRQLSSKDLTVSISSANLLHCVKVLLIVTIINLIYDEVPLI